MSDHAYRGLHYDDPHVQAEFDRLVQRIGDAERARAPIAERHRKAERDMDSGAISGARFRSIDDEYIAANNAIAAAQRAVDDFLRIHRNYRAS